MSLSTLASLFELGSSTIDLESLERFGAEIDTLLATGLVRETALATEVVCTECGAPHTTPVIQHEGQYVRYCADGAGLATVAPGSLRRFVFEPRVLVAAVGTAFGIARRSEEFVRGVCWRIGFVRVAERDVLLIMARTLNDPQSFLEVAATLKRRASNGAGMILCGAPPRVDRGLFPRGLKTARFADVVSLSNRGGLTGDLWAVARALNLHARGRGQHGVSREHPKLGSYIDSMLASGKADNSNTAEARSLLSNPAPWAEPGAPPPSLDALRMMIGRRRRAQS